MIKKNLLRAILLLTVTIFTIINVHAQKVAITTSPASARIYVDGALKATGSFVANVPKKECIRVEVREDGYISEVRSYCRSRGNSPPDADFIQLKQDENLTSAVVAVTTSPQSAKILVNGVLMGTGSLTVTVPSGDCVSVEVMEMGFITQSTNYCKRKGVTSPPKSDYFKLDADESYSSSVEVDNANIDIPLEVKKERTKEEAWKIIISTILGKFDVLEMNDVNSGYLRTAWVGKSSGGSTIRMRVIVKMSSEEPLSYKIKFISEIAPKPQTPYGADEKFLPFSRIWKKYDGFLDELITKLKN